MRIIETEEIMATLTEAAQFYGLTLGEAHERWCAGTLHEPELASLWFMWGDHVETDKAAG